MQKRKTIAVIFGGQSTEHEISCLTASEVVKELDPSKYEMVCVGISPDGIWHRYGVEEVAGLHVEDNKLPRLDEDGPVAVAIRDEDGLRIATHVGDSLTDQVKVDCVFSLLHGTYGEDGTLQGMLEMLGVSYVGSGVTASAIGMDKHFMKLALQAADVPIGPFELVSSAQWLNEKETTIKRIADRLEFPVFVKPARGGSSVGISRVDELTGLEEAVEEARKFDPKVIVEQGFIGAREVECAVLGPAKLGERPRVSCPGEIVVNKDAEFYDYQAKYLPTEGQVDLNIPAKIDEETSKVVRKLAVDSFLALDCEGLARADTFVTAQGEVYVNEVNTMPGFTKLSMFPSLWEASGLSYRELLTDLIEQALARPVNVNR